MLLASSSSGVVEGSGGSSFSPRSVKYGKIMHRTMIPVRIWGWKETMCNSGSLPKPRGIV